jgi:hypothetical protein
MNDVDVVVVAVAVVVIRNSPAPTKAQELTGFSVHRVSWRRKTRSRAD